MTAALYVDFLLDFILESAEVKGLEGLKEDRGLHNPGAIGGYLHGYFQCHYDIDCMLPRESFVVSWQDVSFLVSDASISCSEIF